MNFKERILSKLSSHEVKFSRKQLKFLAELLEANLDEVLEENPNNRTSGKEGVSFQSKIDTLFWLRTSLIFGLTDKSPNFNKQKFEDATSKISRAFDIWG